MAGLNQIWKSVSASYRILGPSDRVKYNLAILAQILLAFFDLLGVVTLGAVGALSVLALQKSEQLPPSVQTLVDVLGLSHLTMTQLALALGVFGCALLVARSCLSVVLIRWIYISLARFQSRALAGIARGYFESHGFLRVSHKIRETEFAFTEGANQTFLILLGSFSVTIGDSALLITLGGILFFIDPLLTLATVVFFGLVAFALQKVLGKRATSAGRLSMETDLKGRREVHESVTFRRNIFVSNRQEVFSQRLGAVSHSIAHAQSTLQQVALVPRYVLESALIIGSVLLVGSQVLRGNPSEAAGTILIFLAAGSRILPSVLRIQVSILNLRNASEQSTYTLELARNFGSGPELAMSRGTFAQPSVERQRHSSFTGSVQVSGVNFRHPDSDNSDLFRNISLNVLPGESVAIVGPSGSGKSTLMDLILGVLQPNSGTVLLSGVDPTRAYAIWGGAVGYIPQEVPILRGDVRSNLSLRLGKSGYQDSEMWAVLDQVGLTEFCQEREGLETQLIGDGLNLSGGQRQRLGVARALLSNPRLLVMDEATSSLDATSEALISSAIADIRTNATLLVVAHRLTLIQDFDRIYYLDNGIIVGAGNFTELRASIPAFDEQARLLGL